MRSRSPDVSGAGANASSVGRVGGVGASARMSSTGLRGGSGAGKSLPFEAAEAASALSLVSAAAVGAGCGAATFAGGSALATCRCGGRGRDVAAAADRHGLDAARLFLVVGAAGFRAEQPGEQSSAAATRAGVAVGDLDLAAARFDLRLRLVVARHRLAVAGNEDGLAVGEEPRQRVAVHPRPVANVAAVDMIHGV